MTFDLDDLDQGHQPSGFQMPISALVYLQSSVKFRLELLKLSLGQTDGQTDVCTDGWTHACIHGADYSIHHDHSVAVDNKYFCLFLRIT